MQYAHRLYLNNKRVAGTVIIPDGTTQIVNYAFANCDVITSIVIPSTVTTITNWAFMNCNYLESVYITDLSAYLNINGVSPMMYANKLYLNNEIVTGDIVIPNDVIRICAYAFDGCDGIKSVMIPNSVTSIGSYAFSGCSK